MPALPRSILLPLATLAATAPFLSPTLRAAGPATAPTAPDPSYSELVAQVRALQAEVKQLRAAQASAPSRDDVEATVRRVVADADRRSQLLDTTALSAGWNGERFVVRSDDGRFSLYPLALIQFRYVADYRQTVPDSTQTDSTEDGFEIRRARLGLEGNFASRDLFYHILFADDRGTGTSLLEAYLQNQFTPDLALRAGQFKDPWTLEENIPDARQVSAERSLLNSLIGGANTGWVQGVDAILGQAKPWRTQLVLHDGANSRNTTFVNTPEVPLLGNTPTDFGTTARVEYFLLGTPAQYTSFTALDNKTRDLLVLGAGADFTQAGANDGLFHAADLAWKNTRGLSAFVEYMGLARQISTPSTGPNGVNAGDFYDYGLLAQIAYVFAPKWEVFGRYDWTQLDPSAFTPSRPVHLTTVQEITVGLNYYLYRQNCRLTTSVIYLPDGTPDAPGLGYLATDDASFVLRTQLQLAL